MFRSKDSLINLVENTTDLIIRFDSELRYVYCNKAVEVQLGIPIETLIGKTPLDTGELREQNNFIYNLLNEVLNNGKIKEVEQSIPTLESMKYYNTRIIPEKNEEGRINSLLTISSDITERKQMEENLRAMNTRLELALQTANMAWWEMDIFTGNIIFDRRKAEMLGYQPENFKHYKDFMKLVHPDDQYITMNAMLTHLNGLADKYEAEYRILNKSGEYRWFYDKGSIIDKDSMGKPQKILGYVLDITKRKNSEESLRESEEKYRTLFESMTQGVVCYSADGRIISANPAAERILGFTLDKIQGHTSLDQHWEAIHTDGSDFPGETHPSMVALSTGKVVHNVTMGLYNSQKNNYTWLNINAIPMFKDNHEKPFQVITTFEDVTERKNSEDMVRRRELLMYAAAKIGQLFLNESDKEQALRNALQWIGRASGQDYSYLLIFNTDIVTENPRLSLRYEYIQDGITPFDTQNLEKFSSIIIEPYFYERLSKGESIHGPTKDFPAKERALLEAHGIISILLVPIKIEDQFWGVIGFNNYRIEYGLSIGEESAYTMVASFISGYIERAKSEEILKESEEMLHTVFDNSTIGLEVYDRQAVLRKCNSKVYEMFGTTPEAVIGKFNLRDDPNYQISNVWERLNKGMEVTNEIEFDFKKVTYSTMNTGINYYQIITTPIPKRVSSKVGYIMQIIDISERRRYEQALKESESRYRIVSDLTSDYVYKIDIDINNNLILSFVSDSFYGITGRIMSETSSFDSWVKIFHPEDLKLVKDLIHNLFFTGKPGTLECRSFIKDNQMRWIKIVANPQFDENEKRLVSIIGSVTDITERKLAEEALRESNRFNMQIINCAQNGIIVFDNSMEYLVWNPFMERLSGIPASHVIGKHSTDLFPSFERVGIFEIMKSALKGETSEGIDLSFDLPGVGKDIYISFSTVPLQNANGEIIGAICTVLDISERKKAEDAIRKSEERLRDIIFSMADWVWEVDEQGFYTYSSGKGMNLLGKSNEEILGKTPFDFMVEDEANKIKPIFAEIVRNKMQINNLENWCIGINGEKICLLTNGVPILDKNGNLKGYRGIDKNITERKYMEYALGESEKHYRSLFENILNGIAFCKMLFKDDRPIDFLFLEVNNSFESLTGLKNVVGKKASEVIKKIPESDKYFLKIIGKVSITGISESFEIYLKALDKWFLMSVYSPERGYFVSVFEDITERKLAEQNLKESNKKLEETLAKLKETQQQVLQQERMRSLGQLASGIAHDISNSLTPILGYTDILTDDTEFMSVNQKYINVIIQSAKNIAGTIGRLKKFYKVNLSDEELVKININKIISSTIELTSYKWKNMAESSGIIIEMKKDLEEDLPLARVDDTEIIEALINLVINACDAMPNGGTITLKTFHKNDNIVIQITDTGLGMDEETLKHCLDPFFTTKGEKGTGLGLAMVFGIIERHRGEIEIESEPDKGTSIKLYLPINECISEVKKNEDEAKLIRPLKILCIEDNMIINEMLKIILESKNHTVKKALDGQSGINLFKKSKYENEEFDLVITDLGMPGLDGSTLSKEIKKMNSSIPIILLTGWGALIDKDEYPEIDYLLKKPVMREDLFKAIDILFREKQAD